MAQAETYDKLGLGNNPACTKMLNKVGDNFPEAERVILSVNVVKINKRGKHQNRAMLITDKALYNLKDKDYGKLKRRIELDKIVSMTVSTSSNQFALHIPDEYDYQYESNDKELIHKVLSELYLKRNGKKMVLNKSNTESLNDVIVTKDVARLQTREERLQRYQELMAKENFEDESNDAKNSKVTATFINDSKDKVEPNDFEFLKVIGRGAFGKVMQVKKKDTGEIYAMKILKKKVLIAKGQVEHTNAERKILQQMDHPFLMHLRYAFQTEAKLYFVLDYYRGGELFFHLKKVRRFSEDAGRIIVAEVALALGHLHSMNVIYRDLKPENILLDQTGHVCLTDFGLSKEVQEDETAQTFAGTPEYLAPEIVTNAGHTKEVDWWSLGILCYELTVGIPPFYSQNVNQMYEKIKNGKLLFPPNLSDECKDLITKLLVRDPKRRLGFENDVEDVTRHPFFSKLDLPKLLAKEIEPKYKPKVKAVDDTSNFDTMFLNEAVVDSHVAAPTLNSNKDDGFGNFTFVANKGDALS